MYNINNSSVHKISDQAHEGGLRVKGIFKKSHINKPLVSIITPIFNGERFLQQTIESVIEQSYENIEFIIIDGASEDNSLQIIKNYENRIDYWLSEQDTGIYDAINKGINLSHGDFINILNADDYLENNVINNIADRLCLAINQSCILFGNHYLVDNVLGCKIEMKAQPEKWSDMTVNHQSMFVHRKVYENIGLYNTEYRLASDYDFFLRAKLNNVPFVDLQCRVVNFRLHGCGSRYYLLSKREKNAINKKYFSNSFIKRVQFIKDCFIDVVKINSKKLLYRILGIKNTNYLIRFYARIASRDYSIISR
jgi:glycosyltransferase involved in cell wall biosynthesis